MTKVIDNFVGDDRQLLVAMERLQIQIMRWELETRIKTAAAGAFDILVVADKLERQGDPFCERLREIAAWLDAKPGTR